MAIAQALLYKGKYWKQLFRLMIITISFLTNDIIFEESLTIALIDAKDGVKEIVRLGNEYSMGSFEVLSVTVDSINFRFIGNFLWTVNTVDSPRLRLPFGSDPKV